MQRDAWGRPIRGARISNPWFDPSPPRRAEPYDPYAAHRAAVEAERARQAPPAEPLRSPQRPFAGRPHQEPTPLRRAAPPPPPEPEISEAPPPIAPTTPVPIAAPRADVDRADLRRALADLESAKERVDREGKRTEEAARLRLVGELLPVLDDLDRSIASGSSDKSLLHGVEIVRQSLERVLAGYGLERIAAVNERFDPALHEAIAVAPVTDPSLHGMVVDEVARGYRLGEKVQRPARVRVGQLAVTGAADPLRGRSTP